MWVSNVIFLINIFFVQTSKTVFRRIIVLDDKNSIYSHPYTYSSEPNFLKMEISREGIYVHVLVNLLLMKGIIIIFV